MTQLSKLNSEQLKVHPKAGVSLLEFEDINPSEVISQQAIQYRLHKTTFTFTSYLLLAKNMAASDWTKY